jgi:hypothetical protein
MLESKPSNSESSARTIEALLGPQATLRIENPRDQIEERGIYPKSKG